MTISEKIFVLLEEREMTAGAFAKKTGISRSTISDWKTKKTNPAADKLLCICKVLEITPNELLQDTDSTWVVQSESDGEKMLLEMYRMLPVDEKSRLLSYAKALGKTEESPSA